MTLTFNEVSEIMKIIDTSEAEEVVLELEGFKLVVRRNGAAPSPATVSPPAAATAVAPQPSAAQQPAQAPATPAVPAASGIAEPGTQIRAPMVGSFYSRPSPDQPPFVEVGAKVQAGDPLCLIEVMKLYTTIEAPVAGTVKQIAVENEQLVEFDQLLFVIAPD